MSAKKQTHSNDKEGAKQRIRKSATKHLDTLAQQQTYPATLIKQAQFDPSALNPHNVLQLQRVMGNQAVGKLLSEVRPRLVMQAKFTVGPAHDTYEREADRVAEQVVRAPSPLAPIAHELTYVVQQSTGGRKKADQSSSEGKHAIQRRMEKDKLNVAGETHQDSDKFRPLEKSFAKEKTGLENSYWLEDEFVYQTVKGPKKGDSNLMRVAQCVEEIGETCEAMCEIAGELEIREISGTVTIEQWKDSMKTHVLGAYAAFRRLGQEDKDNASVAYKLCEDMMKVVFNLESRAVDGDTARQEMGTLREKVRAISGVEPVEFMIGEKGSVVVRQERSRQMATAANESGKKGTWKIGQEHVEDMKGENLVDSAKVNLISQNEFLTEVMQWVKS